MLVAALLPIISSFEISFRFVISYPLYTHHEPACLCLWFKKFFPFARQQWLVIPKQGPDYRENYEILRHKKTRIYFTGKSLKSLRTKVVSIISFFIVCWFWTCKDVLGLIINDSFLQKKKENKKNLFIVL